MSTGTYIEASTLSVDDYLDRWLQNAARGRLRERTFDDYSDLLKRYVRPALGKMRLCDLRPLDIQNLYTDMQDSDLSARTVRYTHAVLNSALKQAVKWLMLSQNPAALVELPKLTRKEMAALSGLQWKDIDLETGVATVQRALVWRDKKKGWSFTEPKTSKSRRNIPLPASIVRSLASHKARQGEQRLKAGKKYETTILSFATRKGTPLMRRNILRKHFRPILESSGLPTSIRLYDLGSCGRVE